MPDVETGLRLWVDDLTEDPDTKWRGVAEPQGWVWVRSSQDAIAYLEGVRSGVHPRLVEVSLDYNLSAPYQEQETTGAILQWMVDNEVWPDERLTIHTGDPRGAAILIDAARLHAPSFIEIRRA